MSDVSETEFNPPTTPHPIHRVVSSFLTDVESIRATAGMTSMLLGSVANGLRNKYIAYVQTCEQVEGKEGTYNVPLDKLRRANKLEEDFLQAARAQQIVPRSMIVSLVSQYDAFLSSLLSECFILQPGLVNDSNRTIPFSDLLTYASIEEAKSAVIDAELESLLRDSHHEQFLWLEKRFEIRTLREFKSWPDFVELTQRRNLFVHSDGKVSKQYLKVLREAAASVQLRKLGEQLEADRVYVRKCSDVLYEVAVKLTQILWRKLSPDNLKAVDESFTDITYNLIERRRYALALTLLDFGAESIKRHSSPEFRLRWLINRANAYRLSGDDERCRTLIHSENWDAFDPVFRMAAHLLKGEVHDAMACMRLVGSTGAIRKQDYREWPLFEVFRESAEFIETFEGIFNEDLRNDAGTHAELPTGVTPDTSMPIETLFKDEPEHDILKTHMETV